jgi:high-affinity Fe2+/Pb2+ permease
MALALLTAVVLALVCAVVVLWLAMDLVLQRQEQFAEGLATLIIVLEQGGVIEKAEEGSDD